MKTAAQYLKLYADETRLRCLNLIYHNQSLCVCELTYALQLSQPKISRHLTPLRNMGLITDDRQGKWVYYSINNALKPEQKSIITAIMTATKNSNQAQADQKRLQNMQNRPESLQCC